jgi:hypothetical protein
MLEEASLATYAYRPETYTLVGLVATEVVAICTGTAGLETSTTERVFCAKFAVYA